MESARFMSFFWAAVSGMRSLRPRATKQTQNESLGLVVLRVANRDSLALQLSSELVERSIPERSCRRLQRDSLTAYLSLDVDTSR